MEIMSTLLNINGSMKEFAEDIEERMHKAFRSKAGKKHGMSDLEMELRKINAPKSGFVKVKETAKEMERMAK